MAATGKTPILLYGSTTPTNTPTAGNLTNSSNGCEIAINVADKNLFFKDSTNAVNTVPIRQSSASSNGWLSSTDWNTFNGKAPAFTYTTGYIPFGQGTTTPNQSSNLFWDNSNVRLGIATNSPSHKLHAFVAPATGSLDGLYTSDGTREFGALVTGATYSNFGVGGNEIWMYSGGHNCNIGPYGNAAVKIVANGAERARFFASGGVSIGNTTDPGAANLYVTGKILSGGSSTSYGNISAQTTAASGYPIGAQTSGAGAALYGGWSGSTVVYTVYGNGNVVNTNNSYGAISDAKLKDVIGKAPSYWNKFKQYEFVNYTLKDDGKNTKLLGLVAQQAELISPSVVEESIDYDADGNDLGTVTKNIKYSVVTLQAEVVLQEAQARIEYLESVIESLTTRIEALEK